MKMFVIIDTIINIFEFFLSIMSIRLFKNLCKIALYNDIWLTTLKNSILKNHEFYLLKKM